MIAADSLQVRFKGVHAVRGVSFAVAKGESFGLVGESGSGKSTVLRALAGLNRDYAGRITLDGVALAPVRQKGFFRRVQMVFQDPYGSLHPRHTVDRCLSEPLAIHGIADADRRIRKMLDEVSLPEKFRFRFPHQLSGGQRQRVAIARALILEPELLLLDEPTSALDVSVQAEILNLLADLRAARGLTFLLVSHNLPVVAHLCARVAVMEEGEIVELVPTAAFREGRVSHPRTRALLDAA
jgi:peptide/nickel transport system ATP-binding protein